MKRIPKTAFAVAMGLLVLLHVWLVVLYKDGVVGTAWCLLPAATAIAMCLITKEVFSSLLFGSLSGAILMMSSNELVDIPGKVILCIIGGGEKDVGLINILSSSWNVGILLFLFSLGILVDLVNKSGGRVAFTRLLTSRIKNRRGTQLLTMLVGCICFIDDYFNCLIVGTVMRPVTDSHKISRAKLAYLVDATAAPVCMIVPLSSWVAAVSGYVETEQITGVDLFFKQIPYNFYSLLTLLMIVLIAILNVDFGPMLRHERNAQLNNNVFSSNDRPYEDAEKRENEYVTGAVRDFLVPIFAMTLFCLGGILYTGGFFEGGGFLSSFAASDAARGLALGGTLTCAFTFVYFRIRRSVSFVDSMNAIPNGIKHMAVPVAILVLAWLFGSIARQGLGIGDFFATFISGFEAYVKFLPAFFFLLACFIAFATGTSWGTIAILAPIVVSILNYSENPTTCVIGLSAVCAGAVCGDHSSPISDTSIMASTGAHCSLMDHVITQLPYVMLVVGISFVGYLLTGFVQSQIVCFFMTGVLLMASLLVIKAVLSVWHVGLFEEMAEANGDVGDDDK
ncbi:MAG: Na+/H+ antiporter NhaC family protein [Fibrobacter sp.]|nr:Na+/H+ antiporter NhaC family protein [Fibrobacter sp.]